MLGALEGFSGSLSLCVTIVDIICMFINLTNKDACLKLWRNFIYVCICSV